MKETTIGMNSVFLKACVPSSGFDITGQNRCVHCQDN